MKVHKIVNVDQIKPTTKPQFSIIASTPKTNQNAQSLSHDENYNSTNTHQV
jgi:hypothetical protein